MNEKKIIAVYLRVSSRERALYGYGLDVQKTKIDDYINYEYGKDHDYEIRYFTDDGVSAKDMNRKGISRINKLISTGAVKSLILYKLDRLSRSVVNIYEYIEFLQTYDTTLNAVLDNIDLSTANGRIFIGIMAMIAQWERETIIERTNDGLISCAEQGKSPLPRTPFGYIRSNEGYISINEEERKVINYIYDMAKKMTDINELQTCVIEEYGINLTLNKIRKLFSWKVYIGELEYKDKIYTNIYPAIIDKETFEFNAQYARQSGIACMSNQYLFGRKVRCSICGKVMARESAMPRKSSINYYYWCKEHGRVNQKDILFSILPIIEAQKRNKISNEAIKYLNRIEKLIKKKNDIYNKYLYNKIKEDDFNALIDKIDLEIRNINKIHENLLTARTNWWRDITHEQRLLLIKSCINFIIVNPKSKTVVKVDF